jgi:hypothetical protein
MEKNTTTKNLKQSKSMTQDDKLKQEAENICHRQLSFFTPRKGYVCNPNILQCLMDFAKSDCVEEYYKDKLCSNVDLNKSHDGFVKLKVGQMFEVEGKKYIIGLPKSAEQETNEHGQIVFLLNEIN